MSNMCIGKKKGKLSLKSKVLLWVLALAVIAGLGTGVYAASATSSDKLLSGQTGILDPFTLQSTSLSVLQRVSVSESGSDIVPVMLLDEIIVPPEIRIPFRPALRTPFRPPLMLR